MSSSHHNQQKTRRLPLSLALVAVLMFGFGFALVPLYDTLCRVLGINGKVELASELPDEAEISEQADSRHVRVELVTTINEQLDWSFYPLVKTISVAPGKSYTVMFHAKNRSDHAVTVQAIPSVTPTLGAKYLMKTQCFCFQRQTLQAGESVKMPVVFYIDPELPNEYGTLTLAYALFEIGDMSGQGG